MHTSNDSSAQFYRNNGYYIVPETVLPSTLVAKSYDRIPDILRGEYETNIAPWRRWNVGDKYKIQKIDQVHLTDTAIHKLVTHPAIGQWAAEITGARKIQVWATQLFYKPPGGGELGNIGWHTDQENWRFWEGEVFTAWLALSDVTLASGPLSFVEGSHLWEKTLDNGDAYCQNLDELRSQIIKTMPAGESWREVPAVMQAGGLSFHHSEIWHGSAANHASSARCSIAINLRTENSYPVAAAEDYGYCQYLDDEYICPTIYDAGREPDFA